MPPLPQPLRLALRSIFRQPGFSLGVVLTVAIGISANVAIFGYLNFLLWPSIDGPNTERVFFVAQGDPSFGALSYPLFEDLRGDASFGEMIGWHLNGTPVRVDAERTAYAWLHAVSPGYFSFFGTRPVLGRDFVAGDHAAGAPGTVVLGARFWKRHFASDPSVLGRNLELGRESYRIIGVAPEGFVGGSLPTDLYLPMSHAEALSTTLRLFDRTSRAVVCMVRLREEIKPAAARQRLEALNAAIEREHPGETRTGSDSAKLFLSPLAGSTAGDPLIAPAKALAAISLLLLLLAGANLGNLLLARAQARERELGIRLALGATRARIASTIVLESSLLTVAGGALGWLGGRLLLRGVTRYLATAPFGMAGWSEGGAYHWLDARLFGGAVLLTALIALAASAGPALLASRRAPAHSLGGSPVAGRTRRRASAGSVLIAVQFGLSLMLLVSAGLLGGSLRAARGSEIGFDADRLLLAAFAVHGLEPTDRARVYLEIQDALSRLPGIEAATLTQVVPLWGSRSRDVELDERPGETQRALYVAVGPDYFTTLGVPILAGRGLDRRDTSAEVTAVVVNRALADRFWPGADPIGRRLTLRNHPSPAAEVVGIAGDYRQTGPLEPIQPMMFLAFQQEPRERMVLIARTQGRPGRWIEPVRKALSAAVPGTAVIEVDSFSTQLERSLFDRRLYSHASSLFGALGIGLAVQGLFSLMAYSVSRRSREMGVRLAMGATARGISRLVILEALRLAALGAILGLVGALALSRLLAQQLYGVGATEPSVYAGALAALTLAAVLAAWLPARRASRVDPMVVLRQD